MNECFMVLGQLVYLRPASDLRQHVLFLNCCSAMRVVDLKEKTMEPKKHTVNVDVP